MKKILKLSNLIIGTLAIGIISSPLILISCTQDKPTNPPVDPNPNPNPENPNPNPIPPVLAEFAQGGQISYTANSPEDELSPNVKLEVDKYVAVARQLNLDQYTNISKLTNDELNKRLVANHFYNDLSLSIVQGSSQSTGKLILLLNGTYQGHEINNEKITISNFPIFQSNSELDIMNFEILINQKNFINDLKDESMQSITIEEFFKYNTTPLLVRYQYNNFVTFLDINKFYNNGFISNMEFSNINFTNTNWNIKITFSHKEFNGTDWVETPPVTNSLMDYKVNLNIQQAALNILAEQFTQTDNIDPTTYASTVLLKAKQDPNIWANYITFDTNIMNHYFSGQTMKFIMEPTLIFNDKEGTIGGHLSLEISTDITSSIRISIKNFKTIDELFTVDKLNPTNNKVLINKSGAFDIAIMEDLNSEANKLLIQGLGNDESVEIPLQNFVTSFGREVLKSNSNIYSNNWIEAENGNISASLTLLQNLSNEGLSFNLLSNNTSLLDMLSIDNNGLFENTLFKNIVVGQNQDNKKIIVTKQADGNYKVSYSLELNIDYYGGTQEINLSSEVIVNPIPPVNPDPNPIPPVLAEFAQGGQISYTANSPEDELSPNVKLEVDKYVAVARQLNLDQYTNISKLTNDELNKRLVANHFYNDLSLSIVQGSSQSTGKLILLLNGTYQGHEINNEKITISNFPIFQSNSELDIMNFEILINQKNFINDLKDESMQSITIEEFFKYNTTPLLVRYQYNNFVTFLDINKFYNNGFISNMEFSNINFTNTNWNIKITFSHKEFNGTDWVETPPVTNSLMDYKVNLNIQQAALNILAEQFTQTDNIDPTTYASTVLLKAKQDPNIWANYITFDTNIMNHYFSGQTMKFIMEPTLIFNDKEGTIGGHLSLEISTDITSSIRISIKNFKTIDELFTVDKLNPTNNKVLINKSGAFDIAIMEDLNSEANKLLIQGLGNDESVEIPLQNFVTSFGREVLKSNSNIYSNNWIEAENGNISASLTLLQNLSNEGLSFNLLSNNTSLLDMLSIDNNGLFENTLFKNIVVGQNQDNKKIIVTKQADGNYKVSYSLELNIDYYGGTQEINLSSEVIIMANTIN